MVVSHLIYIHDLKSLLSDSPSLGIEDTYKYLGISESFDILHTEIKTKATKEFVWRTIAILNANLKTCNTTQAINGFALPILRYGFGVIDWTKTELMTMDRKVRKLLTKFCYNHPKLNMHRFPMSRKEGSRRITRVLDCYGQEYSSVTKYLKKSAEEEEEDPLAVLVKDLEHKKPPTISLT